jgi:hypothetical protein
VRGKIRGLLYVFCGWVSNIARGAFSLDRRMHPQMGRGHAAAIQRNHACRSGIEMIWAAACLRHTQRGCAKHAAPTV